MSLGQTMILGGGRFHRGGGGGDEMLTTLGWTARMARGAEPVSTERRVSEEAAVMEGASER